MEIIRQKTTTIIMTILMARGIVWLGLLVSSAAWVMDSMPMNAMELNPTAYAKFDQLLC